MTTVCTKGLLNKSTESVTASIAAIAAFAASWVINAKLLRITCAYWLPSFTARICILSGWRGRSATRVQTVLSLHEICFSFIKLRDVF